MFNKNKKKIEEKIINKFISLLDKGYNAQYCFDKFPIFKSYKNEIDLYLDTIDKIKDFKFIKPSDKFEKYNLEKIYQNAQETKDNYSSRNTIAHRHLKLKKPFLKPVIVFISAFLFLTFSYTGAVFASEDTIPGDALYNVKISAEAIQTSFTPYSKKGSLHFKFLNRRMGEAGIILDKNINISDEKMNDLLKAIDLEFKKCNEYHYFNKQESETFNNEINDIKMETQKRIRKRNGLGNDNIDGQSMPTDTTTSSDSLKGASNSNCEGFGYGSGKNNP